MEAFAINTQYVDFPVGDNGFFNENYKCRFSIKSKMRKLELDEGSEVILLRPSTNDFLFTNEGLITKVFDYSIATNNLGVNSRVNISKPQEPLFLHGYELTINKKLTKNNHLSDLEYSLESVYNHYKPIRHFQQQYRGLIKNDYDTIVNGWVYAIRTVFGKLVNALPRQNKLEFSLLAMDKFSTIDFKTISLEKGLDFLLKYINGRILNRGRLLVSTYDMIEEHLSNQLPIEEVGFFNPTKDKSDGLAVQAQIFKKLFSLEKSNSLELLMKKSFQENSQIEERFSNIFKKETWPIDLRLRA